MVSEAPSPRPEPRRVVLIAGPTASGKSALALELARAARGVVINADASQVYRELRILTSRPSPAEERSAPHRLYGHVPAAESYSAGRWLEAAAAELRAAWDAGRLPIVTGGTGLYFRVLEEGLAPIPAIPETVRAGWRRRLAAEGARALHCTLARRDPRSAAGIAAADGQRILRALEVLEATGRPLSAWQQGAGSGSPLEGACIGRFHLLPERAQLYARCNARVPAMLAAGAMDEVRHLLTLGLDPTLPAMKAIGVAEFAAVLAGTAGLEAAVAAAQSRTRNLAKRQITWARSNMMSWHVLATQDSKTLINEIFSFVRETG